MHHIEKTTVSGRVEHVFAHRFTVKTADAVILADLTPHGLKYVPLKGGDDVVIEGEQKPSEIRVESISIGPRTYILPPQPEHRGPQHSGPGMHHRGPPHRGGSHGRGEDIDTSVAKKALQAEGYDIVGDPRLRHRHTEWLVKKGGEVFEAHVTFDGEIRHVDPAEPRGKWDGRKV